MARVWADKGYTGQAPADAATKAGIDLEIDSGPKPVGGYIVQPRRWDVERTNGWINRHRRLVRQYEATLTAHEAFAFLAQIRLLLRRLDRHG
ncbi:transposase [Oerskovia flava]|uniref:transposase n=1 Tax=Oerskovia flava TaxID=2986422 RepID=UPI002240509F|nr:transposase [Oerskovia sp. JB1-3-2]